MLAKRPISNVDEFYSNLKCVINATAELNDGLITNLCKIVIFLHFVYYASLNATSMTVCDIMPLQKQTKFRITIVNSRSDWFY